ncbi:hypothetical protein GCM10010211_24580 [Streptomyces albospinus]|uniref:Uncharacterized protein n=1 Tax=Streptomyces albospinus TaxID=285515 RepID=A0ABQ2UZM1_9ACTN|nr:hypothetical protein GCM10010211_24580 [Streptomyces albospinus]
MRPDRDIGAHPWVQHSALRSNRRRHGSLLFRTIDIGSVQADALGAVVRIAIEDSLTRGHEQRAY